LRTSGYFFRGRRAGSGQAGQVEIAALRRGEEGVDHLPLAGDIGVPGLDLGSAHPAPGPAESGLTWNLLGLISMDNTVTVHAVFTRR
jgi:hypothetical protein